TQPQCPACAPGAQTLQWMIGCDLLDDNSTREYYQCACDGRDFIAFDKDTKTFTAADPAAVITERKWEEDGTEAERQKGYVEGTCIAWLQRYLSDGQAELHRKERRRVRVWGREAQGTLSLSCRVY
ncbi:HA1F protein, partial [Semnornis frantzii]|nr:HA1F protein [Semnornis frantzii]